MTERPILFSASMVRAILAGAKSQTRRVVKSRSRTHDHFALVDYGAGWWPYLSDDGESSITDDGNETPIPCPYGRTGDRLWVRETWALVDADHKPADFERATRIVYRADGLTVPNQRDPEIRAMFAGRNALPDAGMKWRSSTSMPRVASRLTLEITGVRVERLQDISEADAMAEGVARDTEPCDHARRTCDEIGCLGATCRASYCELWESIHGPGSWDANPWVWVIEFRQEPPA